MPSRSLLLPLVASVAFITGVFAGRFTDVVDTVGAGDAFVGTLAAVPGSFVRVLEAIRVQKQGN